MKGMYLGNSVRSMSISRTSGMNHASSIVSCSKWKELLEDNGDVFEVHSGHIIAVVNPITIDLGVR